MPSGGRNRFPDSLRAEAVRLRTQEHLKVREVCARLNISEATGTKWLSGIGYCHPTRASIRPLTREQVNAQITSRITLSDTGCWLWTKRRDPEGYPLLKTDRGVRRAHRVSYMIFVGPIPDGLILDHLCSVRHCVNPAHLEAVVQRTNVLRGKTIPAANSSKTHCKYGHPLVGENLINVTSATGHPARQCRTCVNARTCRRNKVRRAK